MARLSRDPSKLDAETGRSRANCNGQKLLTQPGTNLPKMAPFDVNGTVLGQIRT